MHVLGVTSRAGNCLGGSNTDGLCMLTHARALGNGQQTCLSLQQRPWTELPSHRLLLEPGSIHSPAPPEVLRAASQSRQLTGHGTAQVEKDYLSSPSFKPEIIRSKSGAAAGLCGWVVNIVKYFRIYQVQIPSLTFGWLAMLSGLSTAECGHCQCP